MNPTEPDAGIETEGSLSAEGLDSFIRPDLILVRDQFKTFEEVVRSLAGLMEQQGYVRKTYADAVIAREKEFPTGLATAGIQVAIPHTDVEHCVRPGMAVAISHEPVRVTEMATTDKFVDAKIIFLLSIVEPSEQVKWLQRLVTLFQTPGFLERLHQTANPMACAAFLKQSLRKEVT
jgi:PTS system galactitol-specific IIA component